MMKKNVIIVAELCLNEKSDPYDINFNALVGWTYGYLFSL